MSERKCDNCNASTDSRNLICIKCNGMDIDIELFFGGDIMHEFIKYLDGISLIHLWFSNILQSLRASSNRNTVINFYTLSKFIQQTHFRTNIMNKKQNDNHI